MELYSSPEERDHALEGYSHNPHPHPFWNILSFNPHNLSFSKISFISAIWRKSSPSDVHRTLSKLPWLIMVEQGLECWSLTNTASEYSLHWSPGPCNFSERRACSAFFFGVCVVFLPSAVTHHLRGSAGTKCKVTHSWPSPFLSFCFFFSQRNGKNKSVCSVSKSCDLGRSWDKLNFQGSF